MFTMHRSSWEDNGHYLFELYHPHNNKNYDNSKETLTCTDAAEKKALNLRSAKVLYT